MSEAEAEEKPSLKPSDSQALREKPLSYSFWLGTFLIRGSVAPRVLVDVLIFGIVSLAVVYLAYFAKANSTST